MSLNDNIEQKIADLKAGKLTCEQNVKDFLAEIKKSDEKYNICLEINENALKKAKELDEKRAKKHSLGALYGLCIAVKSNISISDSTISCASKTLENYKGSFNADVIDRILQEDGIIIAVLNNDEFASGSSGENSAFGKTDNPACPGRVPGGSSSGPGAVIAADFCDISLGTDTGGSIRNPASHCAVVGVKPSYGRVSRYGLIDLSMSLDQIGPLSRDLYGSELMMNVISKFSKNDAIMIDKKAPDYTKQELKKKYKIGIIKEFKELVDDKRISNLLDKKIAQLRALGHEIKEISVKNIDLAIQAYYPIVYTEFYSGTRKFDGVKYGEKIEDTIGSEGLRRILGGAEISKSEFAGAYYKKALKVKEIIASEFDKAFKEVDFILTPVTPMLPHKFGTKLTVEQMYAYDAFTIPANLAGICGGVISKDRIEDSGDKVPVGLQILANKFNEDIMFQGMKLLSNLN